MVSKAQDLYDDWLGENGKITLLVRDTLGKFKIDSFYTVGENIIQGIIDGVGSMTNALMEAIQAIANNILKWFKDALTEKSPSKKFMEIGKNAMLGFAKGITDYSFVPQIAVQYAASGTMGAAMMASQPMVSAPQVYNNNRQVNLNGVTINNGMDVSQLRALMKNVIRDEFG
jgi:hypothetical protein